jgi:hypothetical protein
MIKSLKLSKKLSNSKRSKKSKKSKRNQISKSKRNQISKSKQSKSKQSKSKKTYKSQWGGYDWDRWSPFRSTIQNERKLAASYAARQRIYDQAPEILAARQENQNQQNKMAQKHAQFEAQKEADRMKRFENVGDYEGGVE